jgi:two-component system phosphate regulon sensor histidine kinase PhoR
MGWFLRLWTTALLAALAGLGLSTLWLSELLTRHTREATEARLVATARLAAELVARRATEDARGGWDEEADRLGAALAMRVTLVASDGRVLGDSAVDPAGLTHLESHHTRPEIVAALRDGVGIARRRSVTVGEELLYVAARTTLREPAVVRVAVPLAPTTAPARLLRRINLLALSAALLVAAGLAWVVSRRFARRVDALAAAARGYHPDADAEPPGDFGQDEVGRLAQAWAGAAARLERRIDELERHQRVTAAALAGMSEAVIVVDDRSRVQLVNAAARALLGIDESGRGRPFVELVRHPRLTDLVRAALAGAEPEPATLSLHWNAGRTLLARAVPLGTDARDGAVLVISDITPLERADAMRRDFVANVSHELRTPLTVLRGYLDALADELPEGAAARRFVDIMTRQIARLERLVQELLRLARLDAGQEPIQWTVSDVATLFEQVIAELAPAASAKQQRISTRIDPAAATLVGDPAKLHDVLRNLVENAIAYAPPGGAITLEAKPAPSAVELIVADEGPGIPDKDLERIFERFYRVDPGRAPETGGVGLGLAIVKHLVALHGGTVRAANRPTGGAVFTVTLPQTREEAGANDLE